MTNRAAQFAVITLSNTTKLTLDVSVSIGGEDYFVVSLEPGKSTNQLSPTGASWTLSEATSAKVERPGPTAGLPAPTGDEGAKPTDMT